MLNALVGEKLAIISPKPQTTRNRIQGVVHVPKKNGKGGGQIVLIDTPGVHKPDSSLGRKMMVEVREALEGCDLVLVIMDVTRKLDRRDEFALEFARPRADGGAGLRFLLSDTSSLVVAGLVGRVRARFPYAPARSAPPRAARSA